MTAELTVVTLKCSNCGSNLEISNDIEQFACGYCGSMQMVERKGGIVILKALKEAVSKMQIGTDKTAAELAITRLKDEIGQVQMQIAEATLKQNTIKHQDDVFDLTVIAACAAVAFLGGIFALGTYNAFVGLVAAFFLIVLISNCYKYSKRAKSFERKQQEYIKPYLNKLNELAGKLEEKRKIVEE